MVRFRLKEVKNLLKSKTFFVVVVVFTNKDAPGV